MLLALHSVVQTSMLTYYVTSNRNGGQKYLANAKHLYEYDIHTLTFFSNCFYHPLPTDCMNNT